MATKKIAAYRFFISNIFGLLTLAWENHTFRRLAVSLPVDVFWISILFAGR